MAAEVDAKIIRASVQFTNPIKPLTDEDVQGEMTVSEWRQFDAIIDYLGKTTYRETNNAVGWNTGLQDPYRGIRTIDFENMRRDTDVLKAQNWYKMVAEECGLSVEWSGIIGDTMLVRYPIAWQHVYPREGETD